MQPESNSKQALLNQRIQSSLRRAETYTLGLRKAYTRLVIVGLVSSAATTLVAGGTALQGPLVGSGTIGWRITCIVAALLSLISAICMGAGQQLKLGERLPQGLLCVGRLRALDMALAIERRDWNDIAIEYEEIVKGFSDVLIDE